MEDEIKKIIKGIGANDSSEALKKTPFRVVQSYQNLFYGYGKNPLDVIKVLKSQNSSIVSFKEIKFLSTCEHHMIPFFGIINIKYIPNGNIVGFGTILELVKIITRRLQLQESITCEIANTLYEGNLKPKFVEVEVEAKHLCTIAKGESLEPFTLHTYCKLGSI